MKRLYYGYELLTLPASVLSHIGEAGAEALRVLLWLSSDPALADKPRQLSKLAECDAEGTRAALAFWTEKGLFAPEDGSLPAMSVLSESVPASVKQDKTEEKPLLRRADQLPTYTSSELADLLEARVAIRMLVDEAQKAYGKIFNTAEINILVGMTDYLGLSEESVVLLLAHCKRIGKTNLRSVEKYAFRLADRGITDAAALEEEFLRSEAMHSFEGQVRSLFGMKSRALTTKESKMLSAWMDFGYGIDVVRLAYDITVTATGEPSVGYANAILERWHAEGLSDLAAVEKAIEKEKQKKEGKNGQKPALGNSFDTDDFFEAAIKRGFRERRED